MACTCDYSQEGMDRRRIVGSSPNCPAHGAKKDMKDYTIIDVWEVYNASADELGRNTGTIGFFSQDLVAEAMTGPYVKKKRRKAIRVSGEVFLLECETPVDLDNNQAEQLEKVKQNAMKKLTPQEQLALGLIRG